MADIVALTGATGFIGGHVAAALLDAGWRLRVLVRGAPPAALAAAPAVTLVRGALDDPASLRELVSGAAAVVHLAGVVKARRRHEFFAVNRDGVARLLDAVGPGAPRLVLLSSLAAREPGVSAYAASKRAGNAVLAERGDGLAWTILRPPVVYGPGDRNTLAFFRAVARGIGPLLAPEAARVSCLHVGDLAGAVVALLGAGEATHGETYEIADGEPGGYGWRRLIEIAASHLGTRPRIVRVPRSLLGAAARINALVGLAAGRATMLSPDKVREIGHLDWVCRDSGLNEAVGWRPQVSVARGFASTIDWYRREKWL